MLTIVKEENGFTIERYIDDDGDIEKFNKLIGNISLLIIRHQKC